jgi:hypothetical protein
LTEAGKTAQVAIAMRKYSLEILWVCIGHTVRKPLITRQTLSWNPQGTKRRGRPQNTWRGDLEKDISNIDKSCRELEILARDRSTWNIIVTGLCPNGS